MRSVLARSSAIPRTPFIGVRISWLILARNSDFARSAASAWNHGAIGFLLLRRKPLDDALHGKIHRDEDEEQQSQQRRDGDQQELLQRIALMARQSLEIGADFDLRLQIGDGDIVVVEREISRAVQCMSNFERALSTRVRSSISR